MDDDRSMIQLCQGGHPAGFARLVERYQERLYRCAYAMLHSREDARDIAQEVLLRTVRAIDSLDPDRPLWRTANPAVTGLFRRLKGGGGR